MNENEMDRYFWRTGSAGAPITVRTRGALDVLRALFLLFFAAYLVTAAILFLSR